MIGRLFPLLLLLLLIISLSGCGKDQERDVTVFGSGDWRWASFPVSLRADASLHDGGFAEEDLLSAVAFWEGKAGKTLFALDSWPTGLAPFSGRLEDPDTLLGNVIFFQAPWPNQGEWGRRVAGKTVVHISGKAIQHAVVFLNGETELCAALCEGYGEHNMTSRRKLLAHELGHFLGFAHVQDRDSVMYPEILPGGRLDELKVDEGLLRKLTD